MKLEYYKSSSTVKPELIDDSSSKYVTYLRKNIVEKQVTDEMSEETHTVYEYDEAKLTKAEYKQYLTEMSVMNIEQQRADIDYIALMCDVDLGEGIEI